MTLETIGRIKSQGGTQGIYKHQSAQTKSEMTFSVFVPEHAEGAKLPVLWYLSGLTCTHANVTEKGEFRAACAKHGVILIAPDTSPRGDDEGYDFGKGAGFYVDATQAPWSEHFRMAAQLPFPGTRSALQLFRIWRSARAGRRPADRPGTCDPARSVHSRRRDGGRHFSPAMPNGWLPIANGGESAIQYCFVFLYLIFAGPGAWSIDEAIHAKSAG